MDLETPGQFRVTTIAGDLSRSQQAQAHLAASAIENAVGADDRGFALEGLPESLLAKMRETLAISPMKRVGNAKAVEAALISRLDDDEYAAYEAWVRSLTETERRMIIAWFDGQYR